MSPRTPGAAVSSARMRTSTLATLLCGSLGLSCVPPEPPRWVVGYPITWGVAIRVVEDSSYADPLKVPADRTRAEVLPRDTVELQWYGVGPEGSRVDPPIWIAAPVTARYDVLGLLRGELPACPDPLPFSPTLCRFGVGERVRVKLGSEADLHPGESSYYDPLQIITVASDGDIVDPEACLRRILSERSPDLEGCLFATRTVQLGPTLLLWVILDFPDSIKKISEEVVLGPPNLNPVVEGFELTRGSSTGAVTTVLRDGDVVVVARGESIELKLRLGAESAQEFRGAYVNDEGELVAASPHMEELEVAARFTAMVDEYEASEDGLEHRWKVAGTATMHLQVGDDRGGRAFASLRFVADEDP